MLQEEEDFEAVIGGSGVRNEPASWANHEISLVKINLNKFLTFYTSTMQKRILAIGNVSGLA